MLSHPHCEEVILNVRLHQINVLKAGAADVRGCGRGYSTEAVFASQASEQDKHRLSAVVWVLPVSGLRGQY